MNEGVKILIERMKTNPEEFLQGSKWAGLIHGYKSYLSEEDAKTLQDTYNGLMQQEFTEKVMKELLAPEEDDGLGKWYTRQAIGTPLGGATPSRTSGLTLQSDGNGGVVWANSAASSVADAQKYQVEVMKAHLDAHREALKVEEKKHKTLFGKLFNYS